MTVAQFWAGGGLARNWSKGAAAWTPAALFASSEAGAWYDPSDLDTLYTDDGVTNVATDGDAVYRMDDKSGNGHHLRQATAAARPVYRTAGGLHWLQFDGVDDVIITSTSPVLAATHDILGGLLSERASDASSDMFFSYAAGAATTAEVELGVYRSNATTKRIRTIYPGLSTHTNGYNLGAMADAAVITQHKAASNDTRQYVNTVLQLTDTTSTTAFTTPAEFRLGRHTNSSQFLTGRIYGLIVRDLLSDSDRLSAEEWMAPKTGVTL